MDLDLSALTLAQVFGLLALVAAIDVLGSIALAIVGGKFDLGAVAIWIQSHVLRRVFPIFGLAMVGNGIPQLDIPSIPFAAGLAIAALAAYVLETIASLRDSFAGDTAPPVDANPAS